jgi:predicted RNA binding protein YcfA (HicA-like mRNA interferase family)
MPKITPTDYKKLVYVVEQEGFAYSRTKGDHMIFTKKDVIRPVVIPMYEDVPVFIIKNILRTSGISRDRYFELIV